jgi:hypothetical protein
MAMSMAAERERVLLQRDEMVSDENKATTDVNNLF